MSDHRPSPDELLARVQREEGRARRGKLRIFFGYAAGVGKTYAMLEAAQREKAAGMDVVVGYVEPHGRPETTALVKGLEELPTRTVAYRGVTLREFDLDAALKRQPGLILVDELAHTNAEGSRHQKRWQDVQELLEAGIDVFSTLNVQHIESLNDVIAQITGVTVRETLPDSVIEQADDLELIDITADELIERLEAGKVYVPAQAERAIRNYFQKSNLSALRELSLRQAASRISREVESARRERAPGRTWATQERLLVCVGPSPRAARLLRSAKRMAAAFGCEWLAVCVQSPEGRALPAARERIARHLQLAERLGAEAVTLTGDKVGRTLIEYARTRNVTKIIVGKTGLPWWRRLLRNTVVDELLEHSGDIDIYVIRGEREAQEPAAGRGAPVARTGWGVYARTALVVLICGLIGAVFSRLGLAEANIVMAFLLGVAFVAVREGRGPAIAASIASVLVFDFFFVLPYYTFAVADTQYVFTFGVMLGIGLLISTLTARVREQLKASQHQEQHTSALLRLTRQLSELTGTEFLIRTAGRQLMEMFAGEIVVYLRESKGTLELRFGEGTSVARHSVNAVVAQWVTEHDQIAGMGTDTLPNATALFVPLVGSQRTVGALGVRPSDPARFLDPDERRSLETCASLIALAIERDQSVLEAHEAQIQAQTEHLRSSLLSSVSHDLRTPLAAIAGAASSLLEGPPGQDASARRELLQTVVDESHRLARLVDNLLDMTRLESGDVRLNRQWHVLEEIVGSALGRLRRELDRHVVQVEIPGDLPLVHVDGVLIEQVLVNLLENAARYTPAGTQIEIDARHEAGQVQIRVADNGPGIPPGSELRVFEKFYRGAAAADSRRGVGLGLAICQAIVQAHRGQITARNRPDGGAEFTIWLPCEKRAPTVVLDEVPSSRRA
jgi:two-component system sensor histidine kinase KdpD